MSTPIDMTVYHDIFSDKVFKELPDVGVALRSYVVHENGTGRTAGRVAAQTECMQEKKMLHVAC